MPSVVTDDKLVGMDEDERRKVAQLERHSAETEARLAALIAKADLLTMRVTRDESPRAER